MKLALIILLMSATLLQARPTVKRAAFPSVLDHSGIQKYVRENDFEQLCHIINRLQNLLIEANTDNDLNILGEGLENLKEATQSFIKKTIRHQKFSSYWQQTSNAVKQKTPKSRRNHQIKQKLKLELAVTFKYPLLKVSKS